MLLPGNVVHGIVGRKGTAVLGYYLTAVAYRCDVVYGHARLRLAGSLHGLMHVVAPHALATELRQQRRVDVDDAARERVNQEFGHQRQESRQHNEVDGILTQQWHHELWVVQLRLRGHRRLDTKVLCPGQGVGVSLVADHQRTVDALAVCEVFDEVLTVCAAPRHENGNVNHILMFNVSERSEFNV